MAVTRIPAILASLTLIVLTISGANAEKVKGTETCTSGSYARNIGNKPHTCTKKCTTPVTVTTCTGPNNTNCSTSAYNEIRYEGCTANAESQPPRTFGVTPPAGILETMPLDGGGGRPSPTGQPVVRPVAPATKIR